MPCSPVSSCVSVSDAVLSGVSSSYFVPLAQLGKVGLGGQSCQGGPGARLCFWLGEGDGGHCEQEGEELSVGVCKYSVYSEAPEILEKCDFFFF